MKFSVVAAAVAAFTPLKGVAAAPPRPGILDIQVLGGTTFRASQVESSTFTPTARRGPIALANAFNKFNVALSEEMLLLLEQILEELGLINIGGTGTGATRGGGSGSGAGAARNSTAGTNSTSGSAAEGDVIAVPAQFDTQYLCEVEIGTPPQKMTLNFDTGSSDLWVFSSETPKELINGQTIYNIQASSTAKQIPGATWKISYGDGSTSGGNVYEDVVTIGGVSVGNQIVESATNLSASFTQNANEDGLVGLAFGSLNRVFEDGRRDPAKTFMENAAANLASPLFTANLKKDQAGNYNFGFIDKSEFTGDVSFTKINLTSGFWEFQADGYQIGENGQAVTAAHTAIADTGTTLLLLPDEIVSAYYAQVPTAQQSQADGGFIFSCTETLPDYIANIGGYKAVVPGSFINFSPADADTFAQATTCFGGIQSAAGLPFAIYGDVFLKSQFVVFHLGEQALGLATKPLNTTDTT